MWSTGEGNGKQLQYSCLDNPMNSMKRQRTSLLVLSLYSLLNLLFISALIFMISFLLLTVGFFCVCVFVVVLLHFLVALGAN